MSHKQKHTNLPMNSFETERKEGWYGYFDCYIRVIQILAISPTPILWQANTFLLTVSL